MLDVARHIDAAMARRYDPGFVYLAAADLVGLVDHIISISRRCPRLSEAELRILKPFCHAADQLTKHTGQVAIRCEDYYLLGKIARDLAAQDTTSPPTTTTTRIEPTPPHWVADLTAPWVADLMDNNEPRELADKSGPKTDAADDDEMEDQ